MEILNSSLDAEKILNKGVARKAVLHVIEVAHEEKLRHVATLSLVTPRARIATLSLSHSGIEAAPLRPPPVQKPPEQLVCPRCGSPVSNLKLLNRNYCFKCKTYV